MPAALRTLATTATSLCLLCLLAACTTPVSTSTSTSLPAPPASCANGQPAWRLLGEIRWGHDMLFGGTPVGGLSAIDYDAATGEYHLLSDDRSVHGPARWYTARIAYDSQGLHAMELTRATPLRSPLGTPYPRRSAAIAGAPVPDPEALRVVPHAGTGSSTGSGTGSGEILWSSEGDFARRFGPELHAMRRDGHWLRRFALPAHLQLPPAPVRASGPRDNLTLEGLAISPDGRTAWAAMEGPLRQDGAPPSQPRRPRHPSLVAPCASPHLT